MKLLSFLFATILSVAAYAYPDGPYPQRHLSPADLSVNAATLDATVTSTSFKARGYRVMTLACDHVNSAASEIQVRIQHSTDWGTTDAAATWKPLQSGNITEGTDEYNDELLPYEPYRTVAANDNFTIVLNINYLRMRFVITDTGGGASDTVTCDVILG